MPQILCGLHLFFYLIFFLILFQNILIFTFFYLILSYSSTTAEVYNCLVSKIGGDCGEAVVSFLITTWRTMEPNYCTGIINTHYKEPVSDGVQLRTNLGQLGLLVLAIYIFLI